jgi:hypothetical protein
VWAKKNNSAMLESVIDLAPRFQKRNLLQETNLCPGSKWRANSISEQWTQARRGRKCLPFGALHRSCRSKWRCTIKEEVISANSCIPASRCCREAPDDSANTGVSGSADAAFDSEVSKRRSGDAAEVSTVGAGHPHHVSPGLTVAEHRPKQVRSAQADAGSRASPNRR